MKGKSVINNLTLTSFHKRIEKHWRWNDYAEM